MTKGRVEMALPFSPIEYQRLTPALRFVVIHGREIFKEKDHEISAESVIQDVHDTLNRRSISLIAFQIRAECESRGIHVSERIRHSRSTMVGQDSGI